MPALVRYPLVLLTLLLGLACRDGDEAPVVAAPPPDAGLVVRADLDLAWDRGLPLPVEGEPVPDAYGAARATWRTATTAFAMGAYDDAARAFLDAADGLEVAEPHDHRDTFAAGRCMAYENAAVALKGARAPKPMKLRLVRAADTDAACRHSLRRILGRPVPAVPSSTVALPPYILE